MTFTSPTESTNEDEVVCPWCGNSGWTYEITMGQYVRTRCSCASMPPERRGELAAIKDERLSPYHYRPWKKRQDARETQ